ncbi:MAG TPA: hypothetical protein PKA62_14960, partial [Thermoanaerobaculia bacterium]|nr:hypothetical protein [Thermoanaerobaculia bacterium]
LYGALGFEQERSMGEDMVVLRNADGVQLVLHRWDERPVDTLDTALGFTITGSVEEARRFVEQAGFRCLREPEEGDAGFFFIYGDLDGNPINLVGRPTPPARPA